MKTQHAFLSAFLVATLAGAGVAVAQDDGAAPDAAAVVDAATGFTGKSCGDILIILDRSGSMNQCKIGGVSKEAIGKSALRSITDAYPSVPMGIMVFPNTLSAGASGCATGIVTVPVTKGTGPASVADFLNSMPTSVGGTPTGVTLEAAASHVWQDNTINHFVLLITDGMPSCSEGPDCPNGNGSKICPNPTRAYDAITSMRGKGIRTFVIGFEGVCDTPGTLALDPDVLNTMADKGGLPQKGAATKYYSATNSTSLAASLKTVFDTVQNGGGP